jgi:hypothetical protein
MARALWSGGIGLAKERVPLLRGARSFLTGGPGLVLIEPALQESDGGEEVIVECDEPSL